MLFSSDSSVPESLPYHNIDIPKKQNTPCLCEKDTYWQYCTSGDLPSAQRIEKQRHGPYQKPPPPPGLRYSCELPTAPVPDDTPPNSSSLIFASNFPVAAHQYFFHRPPAGTFLSDQA